MPDEKKLYPGDPGYKGGDFTATVRINGQNKEVHTIKDKDGNIVYMGVSNKILGIF